MRMTLDQHLTVIFRCDIRSESHCKSLHSLKLATLVQKLLSLLFSKGYMCTIECFLVQIPETSFDTGLPGYQGS